jgi:hypothetical protein
MSAQTSLFAASIIGRMAKSRSVHWLNALTNVLADYPALRRILDPLMVADQLFAIRKPGDRPICATDDTVRRAELSSSEAGRRGWRTRFGDLLAFLSKILR